ncbi:F-box protein CPR1-like [Rutidosis leptorrhynchoides]|uniref:F-box protein CPR1-like n=1 Tax=Rutidosis leptorrhynchoides TaxID=125765 RepID=UPI003A997C26
MLGGCLCVGIYYRGRVDKWVMKEYGVKESWTKLFSFELKEGTFQSPIAYSRNGDWLLMKLCLQQHPELRQQLCWYDIEGGKIESLEKLNNLMPKTFSAKVMVESLVSLEHVMQEEAN